MKRLISLHLAFIFLLTTIAPAFAQEKSSCENGECIQGIVDKLEKLGSLYRNKCLPKNIKESEITAYHEKNGFTEECWKTITEIKHWEDELLKHQNRLESRLGCASGECKSPQGPGDDLNTQLANLTKVQEEVSCTTEKKALISKQCPADMTCALMSTAMGMGGYLAEVVVPSNWKPNGCNLGDDSCMTQLVTGFLKAAFTFFESVWDLVKIVGKKAGEALSDFWDWVTDAEDHSSTSQLALAKASEDPGVFDMLVKDFPGTMKKIWQALVASIKEWLKTDMFCQKWSGTPHFSQCLTPTNDFDCVPCKTMVNGLCAVSGAILAEVVPSFFTGGLTTAAKYGAQGASKIAKLFKVSSKTMKAIKGTKLGQATLKLSIKADEVLRLTKGLTLAKKAVELGLNAIKTYMLSPARKALKTSLGSLTSLVKKGSVYVAHTPAGKVLIFSAKGIKTAGKIIIYPVENPMTAAAFKYGQRSFDKLFKLGAPKLAGTTGVTALVVNQSPEIEKSLTKLEAARNSVKPQTNVVNALELEHHQKLIPLRKDLLSKALDEGEDLDDVIRQLYPELEYGTLSKTLGEEKVIAAEKELWLEISKLPDGPIKEAMTKKFHLRTQGELRGKIVTSSPKYEEVIQNAHLPKDERFEKAMLIIKREPSSTQEKIKMSKALEKAHLHAPDNGVYEYTWRELREKFRILTEEGGFTADEADELIRAGLAGRPPVRTLVEPGETLFSGFAEDIVDGKYLEKREAFYKLLKERDPQKGFFGKLLNTKDESIKIQDNIESLYFIDYQHSAGELDNILIGSGTVSSSSMSARYEKQAFANFKEARNWLLTEKPEVNKNTLQEIHKRMLKGGVEDAKASDLGVIRDGHWYGNVPSSSPINKQVLEEINKNPYLTWVEDGTLSGDRFYGQIQYPNSIYVKKEALDLIRKKNPDLVVKIEEYQKLNKEIPLKENQLSKMKSTDPDYKKLDEEIKALKVRQTELDAEKLKMTNGLVNELIDDLMDWFTRERTLIGEINSPEKLDEYVDLLAQFQRNMVSIHPVPNGNGRSTRELMNYLLMKEGFPPARIIDTNADIYKSIDDWKRIIKHGILASDFLIDDMLERMKFGLPIENSVELITPYTRPPVKMTLKGEKKITQMDGVEYIDPRLYREIIKRELKTNPKLKAELADDPVAAWDKLHKKANEVFANNNIYYKHPKNGIERVEIGYVDDDFKVLYGKPSFDNQELFDFKMKTWYSDDINWRGLASKNKETSEEEILDMFKELNSHMASNAVLRKIGNGSSPEVIRKAALEDFEKFNNDVFGDGLVKMARDHSETGPMYGISYGYSTSKNREVGKAFSMGAMVVAPYGQHKLPELQALLKSRVLVGAKKSMKDVDLGRLKQVRPEFSYKYGRQMEVMGVGASDPDAITIIQTIDAEGEVILTYLRNSKKADEIWVIKGDIGPDEVPTDEQILKTMTLKK